MRKSKFITVFVGCFFLQYNANAIDTTNGIWKNLDEQYEQTVDNKNLISTMLNNRVYYTNTYNSDNPKDEYSDAFLRSKLGLNLRLSDNFIIKSNIEFDVMPQASETVRRNQLSTGGGDKSFENEGAFIDELALNYNYKNFSALAGKFTANFGDAWKLQNWKLQNGIWVNELAREYKQAEKLGFGIIQRAGDQKINGEYVFGLSAFTDDHKNLDNSIITSRDGALKTDGALRGTRNLDSYVLSTDIYYDFGNGEKLSYHFAYLNLAINDRQNQSNIPTSIGDEKAIALNMNYKYPINNNFLLDSFVEYTNISNAGGDTEANADYLTLNFTTYIHKDFSITLAMAKKKQIKIGENGVDKSINELSFGYKFDDLNSALKGFFVSVGYREGKVNDKFVPIKDKAFGFLVAHKIEF